MKGKLDIPASDTSLDLPLQGVLEGVEEYLTERLKCVFLEEERADIFERVNRGRKQQLSRYPVCTNPMPLFQARMLGDSEWTPIVGELTRADLGTVVVDPVGSEWPPPAAYPRLGYSQALDWVWDQVRVVYIAGVQTSGDPSSRYPIPKRLQDITAALTVYFWDLHQAGGRTSETIGRITQVYTSADMPGWANPILSSLERAQETAWVA